jgi:hypothetical protein
MTGVHLGPGRVVQGKAASFPPSFQLAILQHHSSDPFTHLTVFLTRPALRLQRVNNQAVRLFRMINVDYVLACRPISDAEGCGSAII